MVPTNVAQWCCVTHCDGRRFPELPVCGKHAQEIYLAVKDRLDAATTADRIKAASIGAPTMTKAAPLFGKIGSVYFARCGELIKIGYSTNVRARMNALRATLIHSYPGTLRDEKAAHARFGPQWERGEYFRCEGALAEYIAELEAS